LLVERLTYSRWDNIETAEELIKSFPIMEEVARRMGRIDNAVTSEEVQSDARLSGLVNSMLGKISTSRSGRTNIINIDVVSDDPREARAIAQHTAEVFAVVHEQRKSRQDRDTREFIERQLNRARSLLTEAERDLEQFRRSNSAPLLQDNVSDELTRLNDLKSELRGVDYQIDDLEVQYAQLRRRMEQSLSKPENERTRDWLKRMDSGAAQGTPTFEDTLNRFTSGLDWVNTETGKAIVYSSMSGQLMQLELRMRELEKYYNPGYPEIREVQDQINELLGVMEREIRSNLDLLQSKRQRLVTVIDSLQTVLKNVPAGMRVFSELTREVNLRTQQYEQLNEKYQEALIREADQEDEVTVVRPAMLNMTPINIDMFRTVSVGVVIGFFLGVILAFLFETFDTSIGTIEDVEDYLQVPVLGVIPHMELEDLVEDLLERFPQWESNPNLEASARLITHFAPKDPVAEAFRTLRTTLQFRLMSRNIKTIVATSAALQEGKTTTLVNLSISLAQDGKKVLLVGCNLRRPTIYRVFGIEQSPGVTDIVLGSMQWRESIKDFNDIIMGDLGMDTTLMTPGIDNLHIVTSGRVPPNPSEMLGSTQMKAFLEEAREEYDIVLVDAPPILPVTDAAILANRADAVLLAYRSGKVPRAALRRAKVQIEAVGGNVLGVVLNDLKSEIVGGADSQYYYGRYYGEGKRREDDLVGEESGKGGGPIRRMVKRLPGFGGK
ncbi:polysaccharide biosynthesis tyrosine autokinase, partial [bacterium]|nr:polysaccharide biosynthesis tyrosine autokinase [bacterium]